MKWDPKDFLLAIFLCMAFVVIVGYGINLFGIFDMNGVEIVVKFGVSVMLVGFCLCVVGIAFAMGCQIWQQDSKQNVCDNPAIVFSVQDEKGCVHKLKVKILEVVQNNKEKQK